MSGAEADPLYELCRSLPGVTEDVKWGDNLVFSVGRKMFAVFNVPAGEPFSFKAEADVFTMLTQQPGIRPAPYLARHSWIAVDRRDVLPLETVQDLMEEAHALVAAKLPKRLRQELGL